MLTTWENDIHHLCAQCAAPLTLSCPAALCGWNWWLAWPSLRLLRLCVQLFQVSVMLLCVCLQKWVSLDEGWCWNHSSSYNTMPKLTRFGGQGSGVHCQVINRSKFPDYETQGHLGQDQDAERSTTLIIAALAQNSFPYLCSNMTPDFAPNNPCCGWLDPPKLQDVSVAAAVAEREIRCEDI